VTEAAEAVAAARRDTGSAGAGEVVVSAGGGAVGAALLRCALAARPLSPLAEAPWRLLVGPNTPEPDFRALAAAAPPGVTVERARPDFVALLTRARLSISQGGYNTLMEVMAAGLPGVVVPFAGGSETEQTQRARLLADTGLITVVDEESLTPETLAEGIARALHRGSTGGGAPFRFDGAAETARHLIARLKQAAA
jgi:predicted glycosyltransferase